MGTYFTVQAKYKYYNEAAFVQAVDRLVEGGWMDKDGYWLDEIGLREGKHRGTNKKLLTLKIPYACRRNIGKVLDSLSIGTSSYRIVSSCSDGDFWGSYAEFSERKGVSKLTRIDYSDLNIFAKENDMSVVDFDKDETLEYISEIEEAFHDKFWKEKI